MPPNSKNGDDASDESPTGPPGRPGGLLEQLRSIIEALAEIEDEEGGYRRGSDHIDRGSTRIDYDYDVSVGLGSGDRTGSSGEQSVSDSSRTDGTRSQQGDENPVHIETREVSQDELHVIADLPDVADDKLDVELDAEEPALELHTEDEIVERISLDRSNVTITDVTLNNQILDIRLARPPGPKEGESE